jgi:hypothetical protein
MSLFKSLISPENTKELNNNQNQSRPAEKKKFFVSSFPPAALSSTHACTSLQSALSSSSSHSGISVSSSSRCVSLSCSAKEHEITSSCQKDGGTFSPYSLLTSLT